MNSHTTTQTATLPVTNPHHWIALGLLAVLLLMLAAAAVQTIRHDKDNGDD